MSIAPDHVQVPSLVQDPQAWDSLVLAHPHASFLQSATWGRFKRSFGWAPARLHIPVRPGAPAPVAQVLFRRIPFSPFTYGYLPRGPLLDFEDEDALEAMERALARLARRYQAVAITWELPVPEGSTAPARLARRGLVPARPLQARCTSLVDLSPDLEEVAARQKPRWRYKIRLAARHGVAVRPAAGVEDVARWYDLLRATGQRDNFTVRDEGYYRRFWQQGSSSGDTVLLLAEHAGVLLAGIMVHRFGPEATYLYGASGEEDRNLMPNYLLQWEAMRWAKALGATRYDLFGMPETDDPDEPLAGVGRFKAGFGGRLVRYAGAFDRIYRPALYALLQRARERGWGQAG